MIISSGRSLRTKGRNLISWETQRIRQFCCLLIYLQLLLIQASSNFRCQRKVKWEMEFPKYRILPIWQDELDKKMLNRNNEGSIATNAALKKDIKFTDIFQLQIRSRPWIVLGKHRWCHERFMNIQIALNRSDLSNDEGQSLPNPQNLNFTMMLELCSTRASRCAELRFPQVHHKTLFRSK